uniref:PARP catalytic domain-containing protein n=1 Tax=Hucho hucho TaxID=62062 RepID=A0A4W5KAS5_9TELE
EKMEFSSRSWCGWEAVVEKQIVLKPGQAPRGRQGYTMYHGTHHDSTRAIITGGFRRDIANAQGYPGGCPTGEHVVLQLKVRVGRVKKMDMQNVAMWCSWQQSRYDTAWLPSTVIGHEEDWVKDPKRVAVNGIAHCGDPATKQALEKLISQQRQEAESSGRVVGGCKWCKMQTPIGHSLEVCWGCGTTVCPFMDKHVCKRSS